MNKNIIDRPAIYFSTLEIENVKSFGENQILDLKNRDGSISPWTLILGDNGVGKTTLLHCLALMIPVEAPMLKTETSVLDGETEKKQVIVSVKPYMDDLDEANFDFEKLIRIAENISTKISATLTNGVELKERQTEDSAIAIAMEFEKIKGKLEVITPLYDKVDVFESPKIFAYGANRHVAYKNIDNSELKDPIYNLFSGSGDLYDAEQVLSMLDTASIRLGGTGKAADLLLKIKEILVDLLPDIKDINSIIINSPINEDGSINENIVEVQTEDGRVKLFNLSLGYLTMLTWIVDLAVHMLWAFPESNEPLKEPAIVLVDEIDLHLHPVWQRMIMKKLTDHFPRTQFICTAHSPIMAQASENQNLAVVKRDNDGEVSIENLPNIVKGWRIGQLLTSELFNVPSDRSPEIEDEINERRDLLDIENPTAENESKIKELDKRLSALPVTENSEDQKLLDQIREAAKLLKEKGLINDKD